VRQVRAAYYADLPNPVAEEAGSMREIHWGRAVLTICRRALRRIRLRRPSVLAVLDSSV